MTNYEKIERYINKESDFSEICTIGTKSAVLRTLKNYVKKNPDKLEEVNDIIEHIDELMDIELSDEQFQIILNQITNGRRCSVSLGLLADLLLVSEDEAIEIIRKRNMTSRDFEIFISAITKSYPKQTKQIDYVKGLYNKYLEKYNITEEKKQATYIKRALYEDEPNEYINLLKDVLDSGLCAMEYCSKKGITYNTITNAMRHLQNGSKNEPIINEINNRSDEKFNKYMVYAIEQMCNVDEFDMSVYYDYTRLNINDFKKIVESNFPNEQRTRNLLTQIKIGSRKLPKLTKRSILETEKTIAGRVITKEETEMLLDYMEDKNYPVEIYNIVLKKYVNDDIELPKVLVK